MGEGGVFFVFPIRPLNNFSFVRFLLPSKYLKSCEIYTKLTIKIAEQRLTSFYLPLLLLSSLHLLLLIEKPEKFEKCDTLSTVKSFFWNITQLTFTCVKSTIETLEKGVKHVQS